MTIQFDFSQSLRTRNNARTIQAASFLAAVGLFCLTPLLKTPQQKLLASVPGLGLAMVSMLAGRDHLWSDRRVAAFFNAEDAGFRDNLVKNFRGNPGMQAPAQLEAEIIEDEDGDNIQAIVDMADELASSILLALIEMGIPATPETILGRVENESGIAYKLALRPQLLKNKAADLYALASLPVKPEISETPGGTAVLLRRPRIEAGGIDDPIAQKIEATLKKYQAPATSTDKIEGLAFNRFILTPSDGVKFGRIAALEKELQMGLGLQFAPLISATQSGIAIDVAKANRTFVNYSDYIDNEPSDGCQVPIGVDQLSGELVWMDFADSNTPHACFAGTTGSGKSEALRAQVKYVLENHDNTHLLLVDVKASTFSEYAGQPKTTVIENAVHGAITIVEMAAKMEQRRSIRRGFKDVAEYNKQAEKPLPRILIYVEELKDMLDGLKTCTPNELEAMSAAASIAFDSEIHVGYGKVQVDNGEGKMFFVPATSPESLVMMALGRIGQAGRSELISLVLITQEPDKKLLDSLLGNLPAKIALRLNSFIESNVILPGKDAHCEQLLGKGDLIYSVPGKGLQRLQSLWVG